EIRRIQLRLGITTVFVTHDQEEALAVSDRIAVMNAGRIDQIDTPEELYLHPATPHVAGFVGLSSVVPGVAASGRVTVWGRGLAANSATDGEVEVFLRPENLRLVSQADGDIGAVVEESTFLGSIRRTLVRTDAGELVRVQHDARVHPAYGERVWLTIEPVPVAVRPA